MSEVGAFAIRPRWLGHYVSVGAIGHDSCHVRSEAPFDLNSGLRTPLIFDGARKPGVAGVFVASSLEDKGADRKQVSQIWSVCAFPHL